MRKRRTQSGLQAAPLAAEGASRARRAPPTPLAAVRPMPAAAARVRRPSRLFRTPCGPHSGYYSGRRGHATTAPRRHSELPNRGKRIQMSRGRSKLKARAAGRQHASQINSGQLNSGQLNARDHTCKRSACGSCEAASRGGGASRRLRRACSTHASGTADGDTAAPVTCASARQPLRPARATPRPWRPIGTAC